jgi:hypothetical protein
LNLFINKYLAEIKMPGNGIWQLSVPQKFYTEFWNVKNECSSSWQYTLQLSIFSQTLSMASPFKLSSQCKTCSPTPLKLMWARRQWGQYSSFEASLFCTSTARVLHVSLTSEDDEKGGFSGLESKRCLWRFIGWGRGSGTWMPEFLNFKEAQESIPRNEFRQPMQPGGTVR